MRDVYFIDLLDRFSTDAAGQNSTAMFGDHCAPARFQDGKLEVFVRGRNATSLGEALVLRHWDTQQRDARRGGYSSSGATLLEGPIPGAFTVPGTFEPHAPVLEFQVEPGGVRVDGVLLAPGASWRGNVTQSLGDGSGGHVTEELSLRVIGRMTARVQELPLCV